MRSRDTLGNRSSVPSAARAAGGDASDSDTLAASTAASENRHRGIEPRMKRPPSRDTGNFLTRTGVDIGAKRNDERGATRQRVIDSAGLPRSSIGTYARSVGP